MTAGPHLSVVIPALNEEKTVSAVLTRVLEVFDRELIDGEIVFLDDHSTDRTGSLADGIARSDSRVRVIHRRSGGDRGLGSSLREGFHNAKGEYIVVLDCDFSHDPADIPRLLERKNEADIVVGSRFVKGGTADMPLQRTLLSRAYNLCAKALLGLAINDITTGYKLYKAKMLRALELKNNGFGLQVEIIFKAQLKGYTAKEVPIHYLRSDKKSTLSYRKEFVSYMAPLFKAFKARLQGRNRFE
jgi:dolichol-phosphate mannosyltransferase